MTTFVTGGAGFIGSNLVARLLSESEETHVFDNLSTGSFESLGRARANPKFRFQRGDLLDKGLSIPADSKTVFHLAANPDVKSSFDGPQVHFEQNVVATFNVLEAARKADIEAFVFASTSTVYGDAMVMPTPEDYSPLEPISMYGASKLACESLITSYAHSYGIKAVIFRLANIIGADSRHGVIFDFVNKLLHDAGRLEVLGDGSQNKSYLHISDCISAILVGLAKSKDRVSVYNVGSLDQIEVREIAKVVIEAMGARAKIEYAGGEDGRGWKGDVKNMLLDVRRIMSLGWAPKYGSLEAAKITATNLAQGLAYQK